MTSARVTTGLNQRPYWWDTVAIGHTVVALPFVVLIVTVGFAGFDRDLEDAALVLLAEWIRRRGHRNVIVTR